MTFYIDDSPYLRSSREFPEDLHQISVELTKSYIDIASNVNDRTIGIYPTTKAAITGESWFFTKNQKQQSFRKMYEATDLSAIPHTIDTRSVSVFSPKCYGQYYDGTNWGGIIFASDKASITGQISFYIDSTNINFLSGVGAPSVQKIIIVLEWVSNI